MLITHGPEGSTASPAQPAAAGADLKVGIRRVRKLNARQAFAFRLLRDGVAKSQAEAYRIAYGKQDVDAKTAADAGWRLFSQPAMQAAMDSIRFDGMAPLLSLQERLGHLAAIITSPNATRYERIRAAEVYTKIAGDGAPELPPSETPNGDVPRRVVINIFQNAPAHVRSVIPIHARPAGNGNGSTALVKSANPPENGNGHGHP